MRAACFVAVLMTFASGAVAQTPAPAPQPAPSAPAPTPPAAPAAPATPAAPTDAPPAAAPPAAPVEGAPPPPPTYAPAAEPPAAPTYQPLGGKREPEIEKGDWDPWEHVGANKHRHDGFMLRLAIGFGIGGIAGDDHLTDGAETSATGAGFDVAIGIGGALVDNLVLNADIFQTTIFNPAVEVDGRDAGDANDLTIDRGLGEDVELTGLGVGVTYYFMPVNIYLAGAVGIGQVVFVSNAGEREGSDPGLALHFLVGKEWWVGVDWGIGVAGQVAIVRAEDTFLGNVGGLAFGILFSATYN